MDIDESEYININELQSQLKRKRNKKQAFHCYRFHSINK